MEIRILGPLEIIDNGEAVKLRGIEARLLAVLLLDAGRCVSLSRLIEGVWDGEPPATAARQVGNTVSILRRKLGVDRFDRIADGYQFNVEDCTVDALAFDRLARRARATTDTDPPAALALYREALSLWRGTALADLPGRVTDAGARHLADTRLTALEDKIDLELRLGEERNVIGELRWVLAEHPYRQRAAGQLMLALHRQQQVPEALAVYEQIRTRLSEDLGLDPGERLRERHSAILRADPSLSAPTIASAPAMTAVPAQLPVRPAGFTGRVSQLASLDDALAGPARSSVVTGAAGTGKTATAVHWAHGIRDKFPDGQLFINLRGFDHGEPVAPAEALGRFIRALNGPDTPIPSDVDEAAGLYRTVADGRRILVVLDNARDAAQVRPLLPPGSDSFAVVTSRHRLAGLAAVDHAALVGLAPLANEESAQLLTSMIDPSRIDDPTALSRVAELCGHLPLALRIAAAQLASRPGGIAELVADLEGPRRLDTLSLDGDAGSAVAAALGLSVDALTDDARELFLTLGVVPGDDYSQELILAIGPGDKDLTAQVLDRLEALHLIEQHRPERYRLHDLTRLYAATIAAREFQDNRRKSIIDSFIGWHYATDTDVDAGFHEDINISRACREVRQHPRLWQLIVGTVVRDINAGQRLEECRRLIDMALSNATQHNDITGEIRMNSSLAGYHWAIGNIDVSVEVGRRAVLLARSHQHGLYNQVLRNLAVFLRSAGKIVEAETSMREALSCMPDMPRLTQNVGPRLILVRIIKDLGHYHEAQRILAEVRKATDDGGSPEMDIMVRSLVANIALDLGQLTEARSHLAPMLAIADQTVNPRHAFEAQWLKARLLQVEGRHGFALQEYQRTLLLAQRINRRTLQVFVLCELVKLAARTGNRDETAKSLALLSALDDPGRATPEQVAEFALVRGVVHNSTGDHELARTACREAAKLNAAMPRPLEHARSLTTLAEAHTGLGEHDTARNLRDQALTIFTRLGVPEADQLNHDRN